VPAKRPAIQSSPSSLSAMKASPSQTIKPTATVEVEELVLPRKDQWIYKVDIENLVRERQSDPVKALRLPARGLVNLGNTCFMNATLQCLAAGTHFMSALQSAKTSSGSPLLGPHASECIVHKNEFCVYCVVEGFIGRVMVDNSEKRPVVPRALAINIRALGRQFRPGRQEDSHEFLRCLLYRMVLTSLKAHGVKEGSKDRRDETTALHSVFGGYLRNQVHCTSCGFDSNTYDCFLDLSLEVGNGITSVDKALRHFTAKEKLDKNNMWKCPRENKNVCAEKQLTIRSTPSALTIHLKRFSFVPMAKGAGGGSSLYSMLQQLSGGGQKLNSHVKFTDTLDVTAALSDAAVREKRSAIYNLYGVLVHSGHSSNSGHYFSFVKSMLTGKWYLMNDEVVQPVTWEYVEKQQAYILFYSKQETTRATSSQRSTLPIVTPEEEDTKSWLKVKKSMINESEKLRASLSSTSSSSNPSISVEAAGSVPRTIDVLGDVIWVPKNSKAMLSSSANSSSSKILPQYDGAPLSEQVFGLPENAFLSSSESSLGSKKKRTSSPIASVPDVYENPIPDWASRSKELRLISMGKAQPRKRGSRSSSARTLHPRWRWDIKRIIRDSRLAAIEDDVEVDNENEEEENQDEEKENMRSAEALRYEKKRKAVKALADEGREGEFAVRTSALHDAAVLAAGGLYEEGDQDDDDDDEDNEYNDNDGKPDIDENSNDGMDVEQDDANSDAEPENVSFSDAMRQAMDSFRGPSEAEAARRTKIAEEKRMKKEKAQEKGAKAKEQEVKDLLKKAAKQQKSERAKAANDEAKSNSAILPTTNTSSTTSKVIAQVTSKQPSTRDELVHPQQAQVEVFKSTKKAQQMPPAKKLKSPLESVEISGQRRASFSPKEFAAKGAVIGVGAWDDDDDENFPLTGAGEGRDSKGQDWSVQLKDSTAQQPFSSLSGKRDRDSSSIAHSQLSELDEEFDRGKLKKVKVKDTSLSHPGSAAFQSVYEIIKRRGNERK
jgi:ubiquitin carboxyl-terminal hydrolase 36/42